MEKMPIVDNIKKYAVFLDIDGVFCSTRVNFGHTCSKHAMWDKFDPVAIDYMNTLDIKYNIDFVLVSTWKNGIDPNSPMVFHWINSSFRNAGFRGRFPYPHWKTDPSDDRAKYAHIHGRALEIKDYLSEHGPYDDFLVFDDTDYGYNSVLGRKRFIRCDSVDGILSKHMIRAEQLTGPWEKL